MRQINKILFFVLFIMDYCFCANMPIVTNSDIDKLNYCVNKEFASEMYENGVALIIFDNGGTSGLQVTARYNDGVDVTSDVSELEMNDLLKLQKICLRPGTPIMVTVCLLLKHVIDGRDNGTIQVSDTYPLMQIRTVGMGPNTTGVPNFTPLPALKVENDTTYMRVEQVNYLNGLFQNFNHSREDYAFLNRAISLLRGEDDEIVSPRKRRKMFSSERVVNKLRIINNRVIIRKNTGLIVLVSEWNIDGGDKRRRVFSLEEQGKSTLLKLLALAKTYNSEFFFAYISYLLEQGLYNHYRS